MPSINSSSPSPERRCCDYRKLNLFALGGTLVYAGYLLGSMENGAESVFAAVNSAFTNSDNSDDGRVGGLRAASPSASWDTRLTNSDSWDIGMGEEDEDDHIELPSSHVEKRAPSYANGPVIYKHDGPVSTINLVGERHSGTNWITDHLVDCFGDKIQVQTNFTRFKHWFQIDDEHYRNDSAVVIAMFRDPYDWVEAMRERPHHAHGHIGMEWKDFVTKPWVGPRGPADKIKMQKSKEEGKPIETCLAGYKFDEVVPCSLEDSISNDGYSNYMYELMHDSSHRAYGSIIDLRRDKILNFLQIPKFHGVRAFFPERYEALNLRGTAGLLAQLEEVTGFKAKCEPFEGTGVVTHKAVDPEYTKWMNKFVDWDVEGMIGYVQREPIPWTPPTAVGANVETSVSPAI
ncbi:hypothetical protein ACHAWX_005085 [Stephanocyclus meneghinianus]